MNPLIKDYIVVAVKAVLTAVLGAIVAWFAKKGITIPSADDTVIGAIATAIVAGIAMLLSRISWRKWFATAQAMDAGVTENQVKAAVAAGQAPAPTPANKSPTLSTPQINP